MAGSITFEVTPLHIFQRKFNSAELEEALRFSHIYIISRRPATRIRYVFAGKRHVFFSFATKESVDGTIITHDYEMRFPEASKLSAKSHEGGEYFSVQVDDQVLHGDSWSLLSCVTDAWPKISWHEVLYIGMAFGKDGERNVSHRVSEHATLQKIYEEHAGTDWDVFVTPIEVNSNSMLAVDHIDDSEHGPELMLYLKHFQQPSPIVDSRSKLSKESVKLIEHALISAFKPPYNDQLLVRDPSKPTKSMRIVQRIGIRLMMLMVHDWSGVARFISVADTVGQRASFYTFPLSDHPHPGPRGTISGDPFGMISGVQRRFLAMADKFDGSTSVLSIFGLKAPDVRRPPHVNI